MNGLDNSLQGLDRSHPASIKARAKSRENLFQRSS